MFCFFKVGLHAINDKEESKRGQTQRNIAHWLASGKVWCMEAGRSSQQNQPVNVMFPGCFQLLGFCFFLSSREASYLPKFVGSLKITLFWPLFGKVRSDGRGKVVTEQRPGAVWSERVKLERLAGRVAASPSGKRNSREKQQ